MVRKKVRFDRTRLEKAMAAQGLRAQKELARRADVCLRRVVDVANERHVTDKIADSIAAAVGTPLAELLIPEPEPAGFEQAAGVVPTQHGRQSVSPSAEAVVPLRVYCPLEKEFSRRFNAIAKRHGLLVDWVTHTGHARQILADAIDDRDTCEHAALVLGPSCRVLANEGRLGHLEPLPREWLETHNPRFRSNCWIGWYRGVYGIAMQREFKERYFRDRSNGQISWGELLELLGSFKNPSQKPRMIAASPRRSTGAIDLAYTLLRNAGIHMKDLKTDRGPALHVLEEFHKHVYRFPSMRGKESEYLTSVDIAVWFAHDLRREIRRHEMEGCVEVVIPQDTAWEVGGAAVLRGSRNLDAAFRLLGLLLSEEVQRINAGIGGRYSVFDELPPPVEEPPWKDMCAYISVPDFNEVMKDFRYTQDLIELADLAASAPEDQ